MADDLSPAEMRVVRAVLGGQKLQFALKKFLPGTKSKTPAYNRIWRKCKTAEREQEQKKGNQRTCCFVLVMLSQNCNSTHTHTHTHTHKHTHVHAHTPIIVRASLRKYESVCSLKRAVNNAEMERVKAVSEMKQLRAQLASSEKR